MNAWLLTWVSHTTTVQEPVVAILSSRKSDRAVAELMEFLVLRANSTARSAAYYSNRRKELVFKAQTPLVINRIPHGERILCGHDPWLYGRKVRQLKISVDERANEEILTWQEPDDFRWTSTQAIEVANPSELKTLRRQNQPLSMDLHRPRSDA